MEMHLLGVSVKDRKRLRIGKGKVKNFEARDGIF